MVYRENSISYIYFELEVSLSNKYRNISYWSQCAKYIEEVIKLDRIEISQFLEMQDAMFMVHNELRHFILQSSLLKVQIFNIKSGWWTYTCRIYTACKIKESQSLYGRSITFFVEGNIELDHVVGTAFFQASFIL